jgi:hypothetical protein
VKGRKFVENKHRSFRDLSDKRILFCVTSGRNWSAGWAQIELHSRGVSGESTA